MTVQDFPMLLGAFGAFLLILGGGVKWLIAHLDAKTALMQLVEAKARADMTFMFQNEINTLRIEVEKLRAEKSIFMKRVYQLESFIHDQPGINIPKMTGWPPA